MFSPRRTIPSRTSSALRLPFFWALVASLPIGLYWGNWSLSSVMSMVLLRPFSLSISDMCAQNLGSFLRAFHQWTSVKGLPLLPFAYIFCASSISWSLEYPLVCIFDTALQHPLKLLINIFNRDQWTFNWLMSLWRSAGAFLLKCSAISFQKASPFLSFPFIGSLELFNQALAYE